LYIFLVRLHLSLTAAQFALLKNLSENPENIVIGLVRDKVTTDKKIADEIGNRSNIHIFQADLLNFDDLKVSSLCLKHNTPRTCQESLLTKTQNTVEPVSQITGGRIDNIIANAALLQHPDVNFPIGVA
jgi:hypothetical protein